MHLHVLVLSCQLLPIHFLLLFDHYLVLLRSFESRLVIQVVFALLILVFKEQFLGFSRRLLGRQSTALFVILSPLRKLKVIYDRAIHWFLRQFRHVTKSLIHGIDLLDVSE